MDIERLFEAFPSMETSRLKLKELEEKDDRDLLEFFSNSEVVKYYGMKPLENVEDTRRLINKFADKYEKKVAIRWGISIREENKVIGTCGYHNWVKGYFKAEIGYELSSTYWKKGIMTEALLEVINFGFKEMNLNRIEALVYPENLASLEMLKKIGFKQEGLLKEYAFFNGGFEDLIMLSLLKRNYIKNI